MAFQRELVPEVEDVEVTNLDVSGSAFVLTLETARRSAPTRSSSPSASPTSPTSRRCSPTCRRIVSRTPGGTSTARRSAGKDVVVIGGGSSALETATLLHENGSRVQVLARSDVHWGGQVPKGSERRLIERIKMPLSSLGHGRENWVLQHVPWLMHYLPAERRLRFTRRHLGPAPAWWLRIVPMGQFPIHVSDRRSTRAALVGEQGPPLDPGTPTGEEREVVADRVVAGTGYVFDLDRIAFIDPDLARRIERHELAPKLSRHFESSVPGLYFVGPIAAESFGPLVRFVAGAPYVVPRVAAQVVAPGRLRTLTAMAPRSTSRRARGLAVAACRGRPRRGRLRQLRYEADDVRLGTPRDGFGPVDRLAVGGDRVERHPVRPGSRRCRSARRCRPTSSARTGSGRRLR